MEAVPERAACACTGHMSFTKYYKDEEDGQGFQERDVKPIEGQPGAGTLNRDVLRVPVLVGDGTEEGGRSITTLTKAGTPVWRRAILWPYLMKWLKAATELNDKGQLVMAKHRPKQQWSEDSMRKVKSAVNKHHALNGLKSPTQDSEFKRIFTTDVKVLLPKGNPNASGTLAKDGRIGDLMSTFDASKHMELQSALIFALGFKTGARGPEVRRFGMDDLQVLQGGIVNVYFGLDKGNRDLGLNRPFGHDATCACIGLSAYVVRDGKGFGTAHCFVCLAMRWLTHPLNQNRVNAK